ncbi:Sec-independent protein translocase subunit TatA/TatB [Paraglaciecola hydrolytica]|uniref:Sec-independent protein translocase subunit TatA/TatB n=1 Tax=Paraglaciecola hydrolytica TaxID=1799789 RepID=UPI0008385A82|nr:twin-arginine translocase TatA/TatE family subunit [Paraglaciecola hydrolytica]
MFDLSWMELLFCAVLALIVIGPKDLPKLFKAVGQFIAKARKMYKNMLGSVQQLEREVDIASGKQQVNENWRDMLPEEVRHLPSDFLPGSMTAEQHLQRRQALDLAREQAISNDVCVQNPQSMVHKARADNAN